MSENRGNGNIRHKVAVIGQAVFNFTDIADSGLILENADVSLFALPAHYDKIGNLYDYTLVICDYDAFITCTELQPFFVKQMSEALNKGANFCFVHYNNSVPPRKVTYPGQMEEYVQMAFKQQIGFQTIYNKGVTAFKESVAFHSGGVKRNVLKPFLDKWGASHLCFEETIKDAFADVLYTVGDTNIVQGFAINLDKGKVILLPFQRDGSRRNNLIDGIKSLVDCLLTYITESQTQVPEWAKYSFFSDEAPLLEDQNKLETSLEAVKTQLKTFEEAKSLLFQSKYILENNLPRFLADNFGLIIERNERYSEDFWLVDANNNKVAIAEIKSIVKGFKKGAIYSALTHRDENGFDNDFPTLLFVNANLQAGGWADKARPIDKQDYEFAAQEGVLIIRIEDVVRLWDAIRNNKLQKSDVLSLLLSNKGWLNVTPDFKIEVKPASKSKPKQLQA